MADFRNRGGTTTSKPLEFIKTYWYILAALLAAFLLFFPYLLKWVGALGANLRAADTAATLKDQQTKSDAAVKTIQTKVTQNNKENATGSIEVQSSKSAQILKKYNKATQDRLSGAALKLATDFGERADKKWWQISTWTENDASIQKTLTDNWFYFADLEKLYYNVYTKSRNLKADVVDLLDPSNLSSVRAYFKTKGLKTFG